MNNYDATVQQHQALAYIDGFWDGEVLPSLQDYIRIPNKSPMFDPDWKRHGYMDEALSHVMAWITAQDVAGLRMTRHQLPERTPLLFLDLPGARDGTILIYGHLDKQPEFDGWDEGLDPWEPVFKEDRLYGRGGADDGYAIYASIAAIKSLQAQKLALPRIVIIIECSEESGSPDLPAYMRTLEDDIGQPGLVIALDSTCGNYDQLWLTTSLRGMIVGELKVEVLEQGVHSGSAGGIVPSSFRVLRQIIGRIEDETTGECVPSYLREPIPDFRRDQAIDAGRALAPTLATMYSYAGDTRPISTDPTTMVLSNTWLASLEVTGMNGMPKPQAAGNVLRPYTGAKLALRLPPTTDAARAADKLSRLLTENTPYGAKVSFALETPSPGWHAPPTTEMLEQSLQAASVAFFGAPALAMGCGGSIPFMEYLATHLPQAQFMVTGVLGPHSNAHGPNEFLHIPTAKKLTACVAKVIDDWRLNA